MSYYSQYNTTMWVIYNRILATEQGQRQVVLPPYWEFMLAVIILIYPVKQRRYKIRQLTLFVQTKLS